MSHENFNFTESFENLCLACLVSHPEKFVVYGPILEPRFFVGVTATIAAKCTLNYSQQYSRFPTWPVLEEMVAREVRRATSDDSRVEEARRYINEVRQLDTSDVDYVVARVVDFARERAVLAALRQSIGALKEGKLGETNVVSLFEDALKVGQNIDDLGYLLHQDAEVIIDKVTAVDYGVKTGYQFLDNVWPRGWGPGWLIVPLAPPKRFKTTFCLNLALNMVSPTIGEDVLYYACEISQELAAARALFNLARQPSEYMFNSIEKFRMAMREGIQNNIAANFLIKSFPSKTAGISEIKAHAKNAIRQLGLKPKAIFIDYAETVKPAKPRGEAKDYRMQADIYTDARSMGAELGCCVVMPDRCNKETVGLATPNMKSFQGAFEKAGIVDIALGLCSTDSEYNEGILRFFNFLNRHGKAYQHWRGRVDAEIYKVIISEEIEWTEEDAGPSEDKGKSRRPKAFRVPDDLEQ